MQVSFKRAIKIDSNTNNSLNYKEKKVDKATMAVIDTIRGNNSTVYDKETSKKIGSFLRAQIGDYSKSTGLFARRINGRIYLFTGEEAKKAKALNAAAEKEKQELEDRYLKGPNKSMPLSEQVELKSEELHKIYRQNIFLKRDRLLLEMVEDGSRLEKPYTTLSFDIDKKGMLQKAEYFSIKCGEESSTSSATLKLN